jgi:hypothetical protein
MHMSLSGQNALDLARFLCFLVSGVRAMEHWTMTLQFSFLLSSPSCSQQLQFYLTMHTNCISIGLAFSSQVSFFHQIKVKTTSILVVWPLFFCGCLLNWQLLLLILWFKLLSVEIWPGEVENGIWKYELGRANVFCCDFMHSWWSGRARRWDLAIDARGF